MAFHRTRTPSESDLGEIERLTGLRLTDGYRQLYLARSGMKAEGFGPEVAVEFGDGLEDELNVQAFLTVDEFRERWQHVEYLRQFVKDFDLGPDFVQPEFLVPIADTYDGVIYIAVGGRHVDHVFFADNGDFGIARLATNVAAFERLIADGG